MHEEEKKIDEQGEDLLIEKVPVSKKALVHDIV